MSNGLGRGQRRVAREARSQRAIAAAVATAREHGMRVEEPVVARVATCMPKLRSPIEQWLEREIAVTCRV